MFISAKIATSQGVVEIASVDGQPMRRGTPVVITIDGDRRQFSAAVGVFDLDPEAARDAILGARAFALPGFVARIQQEAVEEFNAQPRGARSNAQRDGVKESIRNLLNMIKADRPAEDIISMSREISSTLFPWDADPGVRISKIRDEMAHTSPAIEKDLQIIHDVRTALNGAVQVYSDILVDVPDLGLDDMDHDIEDVPAVQTLAPTVAATAKVSEVSVVTPAPAAEVDPDDADYLAAEDAILEAEWDTDTPENPVDDPDAPEQDQPEDDLDDDQDIIIPTWPGQTQAAAEPAGPAVRTQTRPSAGVAPRRLAVAQPEHDDEIPVLDAATPTQGSLFGADPAPAGGTTPVLPFDDVDFRY